MMEYTSINDFINNCNLFTSKEKQEFKNQINLI